MWLSFSRFFPTSSVMDSRADTSSPAWMPVFDVHYIHQDGQDWFSGRNNDEANALTNAQHAAGSMGSSPLPSPSPPTPAVYSFDQWAALLDTDRFPNIYASGYLGLPISGPSPNTSFQDSELSSTYSSYVTLTSLISPCSYSPPRTTAHHCRQCHPHLAMMFHRILLPQTSSFPVRTAPLR